MITNSVSPSRKYVAIAADIRQDGLRTLLFDLPEDLNNNSSTAAVYFVDEEFLNSMEKLVLCMSFENYSDLMYVEKTPGHIPLVKKYLNMWEEKDPEGYFDLMDNKK